MAGHRVRRRLGGRNLGQHRRKIPAHRGHLSPRRRNDSDLGAAIVSIRGSSKPKGDLHSRSPPLLRRSTRSLTSQRRWVSAGRWGLPCRRLLEIAQPAWCAPSGQLPPDHLHLHIGSGGGGSRSGSSSTDAATGAGRGQRKRTFNVARPKIFRPPDFAATMTTPVRVAGSSDLMRPLYSMSAPLVADTIAGWDSRTA